MPSAFMVPGGVSIAGDTFTAKYLYLHDINGKGGSTSNATKAGHLYIFSAYKFDDDIASISFSGGHMLWNRMLRADTVKGAYLEVWAADTDGSATIRGWCCQLIELSPDA